MQINTNTSFKGIKISQANLLGQKLEVYKLGEKDKAFTTQLVKSIDLKKLMPDANPNDLEFHDYILKRSFACAHNKNNESMLLTCDGTPCSILVSNKKRSGEYVDFACSWPIKKNKKAPFGAQILFTQLYKNFLKTDLQFIELNAARIGSAMTKYIQMGFTSRGGDNYTEIMRISRDKVKLFYQTLKENFNLTPSQENKDIDLTKHLKLLQNV